MVLPASHKVSRVSWYSGAELFIIAFTYETITLYGPTFQLCSISHNFTLCSVRNPGDKSPVWALSLSLAATKKIDFSFSSSAYLDVSVQRVYLRTPIDSVHSVWVLPRRVPPFGNLRINTYLRFPVAYRSLSRPSSAPNAKASALCSY